MTAYLIPPLCFREVDNNGLPLAGGLVYSYSAGTTTQIATYTDSTGAVSNTNPVVLNARGEGYIWGAIGVAYKFKVTDSLGNIIRTVDNVTVAPATSGSFVVTATGFSGTAPTGTIYWTQVGNVVTAALLGVIQGTSNDTTFILTGIPPALQPPTVAAFIAVGNAKDNSALTAAAAIEIRAAENTWPLTLSGNTSGWTSSGTKWVDAFTVTYLLL